MKTWIKRSLIGVFAAAVLAGGLAACAPRHHGWGSTHSAEDAARWRERLVDRAGRELQLDDAQKLKLGLLFDRVREQRNTLVGGASSPRAELRALVDGERFDKARAQALIDDKTQALRNGSPQTITALADFYDSLKPEQQQKLRDWMDKRGRGWRS